MLIVIILAMSYMILSLYRQNSLKDTIISQLNSSIESNNAVIKKLQIDIEKFKNREPEIRQKIVEKYIKISPKDDSCTSQLEAVDRLLDAYLEKK